MKVLITVLAFALFGTASAQVFSLGNCDANLQGVNNIDMPKYSGKWYLVKASYITEQAQMKCTQATMTIVNDSEMKMVGEMHFKKADIDPIKVVWSGKLEDSQKGKWIFTPGFIDDSMPIWILDTDYDHFTLSYSCMNSYKGKLEYVWLDSRSKSLDADILQKVETILKEKKINLSLIDELQDCE